MNRNRAGVRAGVVVLLVLAGLLASSRAYAVDRKQLKQDLLQIYPLTKSGGDKDQRITKPGTVLVVLQDGIAGTPTTKIIPTVSIVENGVVRQMGGLMGALTEKKHDRSLEVGEQVYVTDISVTNDSVWLEILTLKTDELIVQGSTEQIRHKSDVHFNFPREVFAELSAAEIKSAVDQTLGVKEEIDNAEPPTLELGQTPEEVEAIMGKPSRIVKAGEKVIYMYPDLKIEFVDGVSTAIE